MSYTARRTGGDGTAVFTFHGTGGDENQFHELAEQVLPGAAVVSPRGDVSEMGAARFFRRTGEGVYDMDDLARATEKMGAFVAAEKGAAKTTFGFGYSNGANILAAVSFAQPTLFDRIVLLHPLIPFEPAPAPELKGRHVLITAGRHDPICPPEHTERLAAYYRAQGAEVGLIWHEGGHEIRREEIEALAAVFAANPAAA